MHELSIALGIVKIAQKEIAKTPSKKIKSIQLEIGSMSGVQLDSLDFVWPIAVKDTVLEHAKRNIHIIAASAKCLECEETFSIEQNYDSCPKCGSFLKGIISGKELLVKSLEVSEG